jgi:guanine deaminase
MSELATRRALRAGLIDFAADDPASLRHVADAALVVDGGRIADSGDYAAVRARHPQLAFEDRRGQLLAPGFIDTHVHLPQIDVIASPAAGLLDWLERHTFPAEMRFADPAVAAAAAAFFLDELARNGTTSALVYGSVHAGSVEALFAEALARGVRLVAGKCLMDVHCPDELRDGAESGVRESADLAARWHGRGRLGYAITPRFAATSSARQLALAGELARARPELYVQSHVAENVDEVRWIARLFPQARSYLDVYDRAGLLSARSVYAHCIWLDDTDRRRMAESGALAAVCPTSNLFLGSGLFDFAASQAAGMRLALGTDVGGGESYSMFSAMRAAHDIARLRGHALGAAQLWYWATRGAAAALGWSESVGSLAPGMEADFVALDPAATPLLARRTGRAASIEEVLFALAVLGDDRAVAETWIAGRPSKPASAAVCAYR